jgi:vanillate O-demethylase monooxygenase subunit
MREGVSRIFFEDEVMLEAQQRGIEANPGYDFYNLNIDAGSMWTRRIVADMIATEAGSGPAAGEGAAAALSAISTGENTAENAGNGQSTGTGLEAEVADGVATHREQPAAGLMARGL